MQKRLVLFSEILLAFSVIAGTVVFVTYKEQNARVKYQRDCYEHGGPTVAGNPEKNKASNNVCGDAKEYMPWWYVLVAWPDGVGGWAVIATGLVIAWQSYETRKAAEATQIAVRLQEDTGKRQLRAYMVVRNSRLIMHEDGSVEAKMELANCGQTPAYDLRGASLCRFTTYPIRNVPSMPDDLRQSQSNIGAGLAFYLLPPVGRHDGGDRKHLLGKLSAESGNLVYCANGYFTYRDIFKDPHWLKFQLIVGGPGGVRLDSDATGQLWASFSNDSEGNEQD